MFLAPYTFDSFFDNSFFNNLKTYSGTYRDTDSGLVVSLDLPGMKKDDISVEVESGYLMVSGKRKWGSETRAVERSYRLPEGLEAAKITAKYEDGVLEVTIPKMEEKKPKRILIQ